MFLQSALRTLITFDNFHFWYIYLVERAAYFMIGSPYGFTNRGGSFRWKSS